MRLPPRPKIIYIDDPTFGGPYPYIFSRIPDAMEAMDLQVVRLNSATATFDSFRREIEQFKPDLLFGFIQDRHQIIKISTFLEEYHPVVAINWFTEDPNGVVGKYAEGAALLDASSRFDIWFTIDNRMLPFWRTKAVFMPVAFDDQVYRDEGIERVYDVSFVGNLAHEHSSRMYWPYMQELARFGKRALLGIDRPMGLPLLPRPLERILRSRRTRHWLQGLPIWRCAWENPKDEREKAVVVNRSKIHFGISRVRGDWEGALRSLLPDYPLDEHGLFYQLKGRLFHAVGAGAMALNDYCPELEDMFVIGREIVTFEFDDFGDLRDKLAWYTAHDEEREKIARAGYERGRKQHTFSARIQQIFDAVRQGI